MYEENALLIHNLNKQHEFVSITTKEKPEHSFPSVQTSFLHIKNAIAF